MNAAKGKGSETQLYNSLRQKEFCPLYLFFGEEDYLVEQYADAVIAAALAPEDKDFNLDIFYGNETDGATIVNAASAFPMMSERRVVIVKEFHHLDNTAQNLLVKYAQNASPSTSLILTGSASALTSSIVKKLLPFGFAVEAKPLYENQAPTWIKAHVKKRGLDIGDEAVTLLAANTGVSLRRLASEIDKIELLLGDRKTIGVADVEAIVGSSKEFTKFELGDAVAEKKLEKSLRILNRLMEWGELPTSVLSSLIRHFFMLAKAKELSTARVSREQIAEALRTNPYFVGKYLQQANCYKREHLAQIFALLLQADQQLKSSYQKPQLTLEMLIFEIYLIS